MKGICFIEPLFPKVVDGYKTMTRRIVTCPKNAFGIQVSKNKNGEVTGVFALDENERTVKPGTELEWRIFPRYKPGETVFLKEPYCIDPKGNIAYKYPPQNILLNFGNVEWKNKLFMPQSAARYFIRITGVRVERLQDISEEDCLKEGIIKKHGSYKDHYLLPGSKSYLDGYFNTAQEAFAALIDSINGKGTWNSNPFVFVYSFKLTKN